MPCGGTLSGGVSAMRYLRIFALACLYFVPTLGVAQDDWRSLNQNGIQAFHEKNYRRAEGLFRKAIKAAGEISAGREVARAESTANLAAVYHVTRRYPEAVSHYKKALRTFEHSPSVETLRLSDTLQKLGLVYTQMMRYDDAEGAYRQVVDLLETQPSRQLETADALDKLAGTVWLAGLFFLSQRDLKPGTPGEVSHSPRQHGMLAMELGPNAGEAQAWGEFFIPSAADLHRQPPGEDMPRANPRGKDAQRHLERALELREKNLGSFDPLVAVSLYRIGSVQAAAKEYDAAAASLLRSLQIQEKAFGQDSPQLSGTLNTYIRVLRRLGNAEEVGRREAQETRIRKSQPAVPN